MRITELEEQLQYARRRPAETVILSQLERLQASMAEVRARSGGDTTEEADLGSKIGVLDLIRHQMRISPVLATALSTSATAATKGKDMHLEKMASLTSEAAAGTSPLDNVVDTLSHIRKHDPFANLLLKPDIAVVIDSIVTGGIGTETGWPTGAPMSFREASTIVANLAPLVIQTAMFFADRTRVAASSRVRREIDTRNDMARASSVEKHLTLVIQQELSSKTEYIRRRTTRFLHRLLTSSKGITADLADVERLFNMIEHTADIDHDGRMRNMFLEDAQRTMITKATAGAHGANAAHIALDHSEKITAGEVTDNASSRAKLLERI